MNNNIVNMFDFTSLCTNVNRRPKTTMNLLTPYKGLG